MKKLHPIIMSIHGRNDVSNKEAAAIIQFSSEENNDDDDYELESL